MGKQFKMTHIPESLSSWRILEGFIHFLTNDQSANLYLHIKHGSCLQLYLIYKESDRPHFLYILYL